MLLHVTNGESAADTLRQTALGGAVLAWQDTLHEGPVPALARQELLQTRARFLAECGWGSRQALLSSLERRDRQLLDALRDGGRVVGVVSHVPELQTRIPTQLRVHRGRDGSRTSLVLT